MRRIALLIVACLMANVLVAQTDLYKHYADRTDIRVASVTNFTLDSGIVADVTLLEAIDDTGWQYLCSEFDLAPLSEDQKRQIAEGWDVAMFAQRSKTDPTKPVEAGDDAQGLNSCYLGVSYKSQTLYIFVCSSEKGSNVVVDYLIEKMRRMHH